MALSTSYGTRPGAASDALPDARVGFIRKTYAHLAGAILAFVLLEVVIFSTPLAGLLAGYLTQSWLLTLALFIGASWIADRWARSDSSRGIQYVGLGIYVVLQALIFVPLLYTALYYANNDPNLIPTAGVITGGLFLGLTAVVFTTGADFSFLRGALILGSLVALGLIVASLLFGFSLGIVFSAAMVGLAAISILYSTSNVLHYYRTDQYVAASLSLFAAMALLFYYVLRVLMALRR